MLTGRLCVWVAASNEKESLFPDFSLLLAFIWPGPLLCLPHLPWPLISHPFLAPLLLPYMWLVPTSEPLHVLFAPRGTLLLSPHLPKSSTSGSLGISLGRPALAPCALKPQGKTPRALSFSHNTQFCLLSSRAPLQDAQQVFILWTEKITGKKLQDK